MCRHTYSEPPDNKSNNAHKHRNGIADKARTKIEACLQLIPLPAYRAVLRHRHCPGKMVWIGVKEKAAMPAVRAFIGKDAF